MKPIHENRAYQDEMENAVIDYLFSEEGNPVVAAPGGCGKSHVMAKLTKRFVTEWPGTRVMLLAQDGKLLTQNSNELLRMWPGAPIGIYSSGLKSRDTRQRIIFGGIQSVAKRAKEFGEFHIVLVDECDQVSPKEETLYQKFFAELREVNPKLKIVGFTATPFRLGMGCLTNFDLWDKIVIDLTKTERFQWFI
jgi:DNA repair protein RadD